MLYRLVAGMVTSGDFESNDSGYKPVQHAWPGVT